MRLTDKEQWELCIPEMGYMALLRNLRNFDAANIDAATAAWIKDKLADPGEVAKSKQLPYRFYSAWLNSGAQWQKTLEKALDAAVPNIPVLEGTSLILIDTSGSMSCPVGGGGVFNRWRGRTGRNAATGREEEIPARTPSCAEVAGLFGLGLAQKNAGRVDVHGFDDRTRDMNDLVQPGLLKQLTKFSQRITGGGTLIEAAVRKLYKGQDRVFIFTDMQTMPSEDAPFYLRNQDVTKAVPKDKHVYGFDLSGYSNSAMAVSDYRHEMGGLTDHTLGTVQALEAGMSGSWPW